MHSWEVLKVPDALLLKAKAAFEKLIDLQSPEVYLQAQGPIRLVVDQVMFSVSSFYDGYEILGGFLPEDDLQVWRDAVVGCGPYHPLYSRFVLHCEKPDGR